MTVKQMSRVGFLTAVPSIAAARTADTTTTRAAAGMDSVRNVLNPLLHAEQIAAAFYYAALTSPLVMRSPALSGPSASAIHPALPPHGKPANVRYLQAALDAEVKHAAAVVDGGAVTSLRHVYFPVVTFQGLGNLSNPNSFLGMMQTLETICVGAYIAAAREFLAIGRPDLAGVAAQIMGVESEHRMLGRAIAGALPANDLTLQPVDFNSVREVVDALRQFESGHGFAVARSAHAVPSAAQAARVVGKHGTRLVTKFL